LCAAAQNAEEVAFQALIAVKPTTAAGIVALATYGVELDMAENGGGAVCCGAPSAVRVLAAIAGIPEENAPMDDEEG
jgi:hypothetical protein